MRPASPRALGELGGVLLERRSGTGLRLVGALDAAFDGVTPRVQRGVHGREHLPPEEGQDDDEEREGAQDEVQAAPVRAD